MKTLSPTIANFSFKEHLIHLAEKLGLYEESHKIEVTPNAYDKYVTWVERSVNSVENKAA